MKQSSYQYFKYLLPLMILIVCAISVWFGGPHLRIADQVPLLAADKRIELIGLLILAWILQLIFLDISHKSPKGKARRHPELLKKMRALQTRFQGAIQFLKKTNTQKSTKNIYLDQLPWHLLIGPIGAGKTSLLANAQVHYILARQFKPNENESLASNNCDWWVTRDLTILDVPGEYIENNSAAEKRFNPVLWKMLLHLIKKSRGKEAIRSITMALPLPELLEATHQAKLQQITQNLARRIGELRKVFRPEITINIIITKCDLLPGFREFFKDIGSDELSQAWGITLPMLKGENPLEAYTQQFNLLIKKLNKQLIWRLHQERNPNARPYIKDFPLQLERLKEVIANVIKLLARAHPTIHFHGIYLTSSDQAEKDTRLNTKLLQADVAAMPHHSTESALQIYKGPRILAKSYFTRQIISHGLMPNHIYQSRFPKQLWLQRAVYAASISLIIGAAAILGKDFENSLKQTYAIQNILKEYQLAAQNVADNSDRLEKSILLLDALQKASRYTTYQGLNISHVLSFYSQKSTQTANTAYRQALQMIVLPGIKNYFDRYLQTVSNKNPDQVYTVLKAYLMLNDVEHLQPDYFMYTLNQILPANLSEPDKAAIFKHLAIAMRMNTQPLKLNAQLIDQARKFLNNRSNIDLAFVILENINDNNFKIDINLGVNTENSPIKINRDNILQIPRMYTSATFSSIFSDEINIAADEVARGSWVLGENTNNNHTATPPAVIAEQLRNYYILRYINTWEDILANLQLVQPQNLVQVDNIVAHLISDNSPLLQLLQTFYQNTQLSPITIASPKLQGLNTLLLNINNQKSHSLYRVFINLDALHRYLQKIITAADATQAAFLATTERARHMDPATDPILQLKTIAEQSPQPIKDWLLEIANATSTYLLQQSALYIDHAWKNEVFEVYKNHIANRYPFANSSQEVQLVQFSAFFGAPGILSNFYQTYLQPFVDNVGGQLQLKSIDNRHLPFSEAALSQIEKGLKIQQQFFPNGDDKLFIPFTLQPIRLGNNVTNFKLNINGQLITHDNNSPPIAHTLSWPGNNKVHNTTLTWSVAGGDKQIVLNGDWGWFKLLNQTKKKIISGKEVLLSFSDNQYNSKYMLFTQGKVNPFLSAAQQGFYLPPQLLDS